MLTSRVAGRADVAAMARLWRAADEARLVEAGLPPGPGADADTAETEGQVRHRLADPSGFALLLEEDGVLVAMALVLRALAGEGAGTDPVPGLAHVSMVAVHPEYWGRGLGALVLDLAQRHADERGFTRAQLWTHETNRRARRLYTGLGWEASGRTGLDDRGEPTLHYVREL